MDEYIKKSEIVELIEQLKSAPICAMLLRDVESLPTITIAPLEHYPDDQPEIAVFDTEEIAEDCTVQVLRNSATGAYSIGWMRQGDE